jgi:hypothetical protein
MRCKRLPNDNFRHLKIRGGINLMKHLLLPICTLAVAFVGAGCASATPIITQHGLTLNSGAITFSDFTCVFNGTGNNVGGCGDVRVSALTPQPAGLQFSTDLVVVGSRSSADLALAFNASDLSGINSVGLSFNSTFMGMDINSVTEDVYTSVNGPLVGTVTVTCGYLGGCSDTTTKTIALNGTYDNLYITKDINLASFNQGGYGSTSIITQTFSNTATPEPVSVAMMGVGLAMFGLVRLRKSKLS